MGGGQVEVKISNREHQGTRKKNCEILDLLDGQSAKAVLNVIVEDVNDENPYFDPPEYSASLSRGMATAGALLTVFSRDRDFGGENDLRYFLENNASGTFRIDETSGRIYLDRPSRIGSEKQHVLQVRARDSGGLTSEAVWHCYRIPCSNNIGFRPK